MTPNNREAEKLVWDAYELVEQGDLIEAKKKLQIALDINDLFPDAHNELSIINGRSGHFADAYYHALRAVELDPRNPKFRMSLAAIQLTRGQYDDALAEAYTVLELNPDHASGYLLVSRILLKMGHPIREIEVQKEIGTEIYKQTARRSDGSPLREGDIRNFTTSVDKFLTWPEPVESFEIGSIKWAWHQIIKHPLGILSNITLFESILTPIARWHYAIVMPIAGFFGVFTPKLPFEGRPYLITCGLSLFLLAMIAPRIYHNPRLRVIQAQSGTRMNPQLVRVMTSALKGAGVGMIAFSLGTIVHQAANTYELIAVAISMTLLIGAILNKGIKKTRYPVSGTHDYSINDDTYTNYTYGFSVSIPEDWKIKTDKSRKGVLVIFSGPEKNVGITIKVNKKRIPDSYGLYIFDNAEAEFRIPPLLRFMAIRS